MKTPINVKRSFFDYIGTVLEVTDGDTIKALLDQGLGDFRRAELRFQGLDADETRTKDKEEKKRGLEQKEYLKSILPVGTPIYVVTYLKDKYGRWVSDVFTIDKEFNVKESMNTLMIEKIESCKKEI